MYCKRDYVGLADMVDGSHWPGAGRACGDGRRGYLVRCSSCASGESEGEGVKIIRILFYIIVGLAVLVGLYL